MNKSIEQQIKEQVMSKDESANYAIEELTHSLDTAIAVVYSDWNLQTDGWNQLTIWTQSSRKSVDVIKSKNKVGHLTVVFSVGAEIAFHIDLLVKENVISYVVIPMIEQFLQGDREEVKLALNPLLEISPAI